MAEYLYSEVHVEEVSGRTREIAGVATATAGFVGFAPKGPGDSPIKVESVAEYEGAFGKVSPEGALSYAVESFFKNGGTKAVILRAASSDASGRKERRSDQLIGSAKAKTGLHALARVQEPLGLLVVPDAAYLPGQDAAEVTRTAASLAQAHRIFHIADVPKAVANKGRTAAIQWSTRLNRSRNLAIYYPWLVAAPGPRKAKALMPPSGVVAGIYARIDQARGVWKAPAGEDAVAMDVTRAAETITSAEADALQSASINTIRNISGSVVLWGARTFAGGNDTEWRYISVRRLVLFLENSIRQGLAWTVFEPNSEALWAEIRLEISSFLHAAWRAGAFQGTRPDDAYFVRCDATTMTQDHIDNGRVVAMIGVAPIRPAEFVAIRIRLLATKIT